MKTNSDWLSGAGEAAAIDASPPPKTSTSCDNSDFLGGAKTFGTAP